MRIALIHAVRLAMQPVEDAFRRHWPNIERMNLLDDSLSMDRARDAELSAALSRRIGALADYAIGCGATGILYTCSAFGDAIQAVKARLGVPVLKPNEAMFEEALRHGERLGLLATFAASIPSMQAELPGVALESVCVPEAMAALQVGDGARHAARARHAVASAVTCPVLTSPDSAVLAMRKRLI